MAPAIRRSNVTRWALWGMVALSAAAGVLCALNIFRPRFRELAFGAGVYVAAWIIGVSVLPGLFQKFIVQPSELSLEKPYLTNYIDSTRKAYQLDAIKETSYPALEDLTPEAIARNQDTIQNIRLWDARPLLQTFEQTQAIRLYYEFHHGRHRPLPPGGRLSSSHAFRPRALEGAARGGANLGQPVSAVHPRLRRGHELRLEDRRGRVSANIFSKTFPPNRPSA